MNTCYHRRWLAVAIAAWLALAAPTLHAEDDKRSAQLR